MWGSRWSGIALVVNKAEAQHKEVARPQCHTHTEKIGVPGACSMLGGVEKSIFGKIVYRLAKGPLSGGDRVVTARVEICYHAHWGFHVHVAVESHGDERSRAQAKNATISKGKTKKTHTITSLQNRDEPLGSCVVCGSGPNPVIGRWRVPLPSPPDLT